MKTQFEITCGIVSRGEFLISEDNKKSTFFYKQTEPDH